MTQLLKSLQTYYVERKPLHKRVTPLVDVSSGFKVDDSVFVERYDIETIFRLRFEVSQIEKEANYAYLEELTKKYRSQIAHQIYGEVVSAIHDVFLKVNEVKNNCSSYEDHEKLREIQEDLMRLVGTMK